MTRFSARNFARGDNPKHGSGIFVGKITATSWGEDHALASSEDESLRTGEDEHC